MKKILFMTGTRADYGKIKSLIKAVESSNDFEAYVFVSGMHLLEIYGGTYREVLKDGYKNVYVDFSQTHRGIMSYDLGNIICDLTGYILHIAPDMIVVHGDRIDALAGATVGALNNIKVAHVEGGELSGTIDESMRHAITKFSHIHLVCNESAKKRLIQLGEKKNYIHVIGSPDVDIMLSANLPTLEQAKERYEVDFEKYALMLYHPVTTEFNSLKKNIKSVINALIDSQKNFIVIYPNNDYGSEIIISELDRIRKKDHFRLFSSLRFEYFLTFLKNADFIVGNSSAGVRESGVYGVPAIDIGTRQSRRYILQDSNIQHVTENEEEILNAIYNTENFRKKIFHYGSGDSTEKFMKILRDPQTWKIGLQKNFVDLLLTED